jgi:hypothetical protein
MARVHPPRSMAKDAFRSPLAIPPLIKGGGGSVIGHATLERLRLTHRDQRLPGGFWTPLSILPLMGGVQNSVACEVGPLPVMTTIVSRFPLATCMPPNHATRHFSLADSLPLLRLCSYWPFIDPVGIHPHWSLASPTGVRRLQNRMLGHHCNAKVRNTKDAAFKLNCGHNPRSHGNGEGGRRRQLMLGLHGYLGVRVRQRTGKFLLCSGNVTKWYQSMVTTLGLIGIMHGSRINSIRSTPMRSNPLT